MEKLQIKEITKEREKECINIIETSIEMPLEEYIAFYDKNIGLMGRVVIDFFSLPKTELHTKFKTQVCKPHRETRTVKLEKDKQNILLDNIKKAQYDSKFLDSEIDIQYKIINKFPTEDGWVLVIGIPYETMEPGRGYQTKFAYTTVVMEKDMPNLYNKLEESMWKYTKE